DVETHHSTLTMIECKFSDLESAVAVAHVAQYLTDSDAVTISIRLIFALFQPLLHGIDRFIQGETSRQVLLWRPANLTVDHTVSSQVLHELAGYAREILGRLHDADRVIEGLQIVDERISVALLREPRLQGPGITCRKRQPDLGRQLHDRRRPHRAVEMVMQRDLRQRAQRYAPDLAVTVGGDHHGYFLSEAAP